MEKIDLLEIRKNLAMIPVLQEKLRNQQYAINEAKSNLNRLLEKYEKESMDVENLKKNSLSTIILKNFGRYEDKVSKESDEMLAAKMEYDKANGVATRLDEQKDELEQRLSVLFQQKSEYEAELKKREAQIKSDTTSEVSMRYKELEDEQCMLAKQLVELEEALNAAKRVISTTDTALDSLRGADNWATFDVWTRGGIFSHMAKYEHIDNAQSEIHSLNFQLDNLKKELKDVNLSCVSSFDGIDSTTRTIDFWFDNIFTDLNVRNRIRDNIERMYDLGKSMDGMVKTLQDNICVVKNKLKDLEQKKNDLLISEI